MIQGRYKATELRVGLRVGAVSGPGELPEQNAGAVVRHVPTRWGGYWEVLMDSGAIESLSCSVTSEMGIGWYALGELS
ncbi:hypothetical protein AK36_6098 (plasmid) [Burkholderia vietnamiensis LMG 10929]|nr:hypothetical protein AK36_6098 [Burkholderia vietnamiensis LMG 10929]